MNWSFTPNYIRQTEAQVALGTVTAARWNELWNLNITQGDHSEIALNALINTSLPAFEAELKAYTDTLEGELATTAGASKIGINAITGVMGTTVQAVAAGLKSLIDTCYKTTDATAALALKESVADANALVKTVSFDAATGTFVFTHQSGSTTVIDTNFEKAVVNFSYDPANQRLVLVDTIGNTSYISLSDFITETEFVDSAQLDFSVNSHSVTATIKSGSITDAMLSSALITTLQGYVSSANTAATNAAASEANASTYKTNAANSAAAASNSATAAANSASSASGSASSAASSAGTATQKATAASDSATAAAASESNAHTSEVNAAASADAANTKASAAAVSATNAKTSETNAKASETNAKTSETNAKTSETNAANSASSASDSAASAASAATSSSNSASSALSSKNAASTSASNAATSAQNAADSASQAAAIVGGDYLLKTGDASNTTVTYTEAASKIALASGEKLSVALGKIKKWFSSLGSAAFTESSAYEAAGNISTHNSAADAHSTLFSNKLNTTGNASNVINSFTQATSRANLATGEKLSVSLGKIMKWYADFGTAAFTDTTAYDASGAASEAVSTHNSAADAHSTLFAGKVDKKVPATAGNLATLDANGNLADSGKTPDSFATASNVGKLLAVGTGFALANGSTRPTLGDKAVDESYTENNTKGATGSYSHAEGAGNTASGSYSHAEGANNIASGDNSHVEGDDNTASGISSHVEGGHNTASTYASHAEGRYTTASGANSHAEGASTTAFGTSSHAEGDGTAANGKYSHAEGYGTTASGDFSHVEGSHTISNVFASHAQGRWSKTLAGSATVYSGTADAFVIGNGTDSSAMANAFRITFDGKTYGMSAFNSSGADYAEYFEWADGNPNNEDRTGYFVTLDGEKICKATNADTYILGIISARPSVIGDSYEDDWSGKYVTDEWGRIQYEPKDIPAETDKDGNVICPARTDTVPKLNPAWDSSNPYSPREQRKEWNPVGMIGKLLVRDDGTCTVKGFCKPNDNGIATTSASGYYVMRRVAANIVEVLLK